MRGPPSRGLPSLAGRAGVARGPGFRHPKSSSHAEVGMSWDRKYWATASLTLWYMYGTCTPSETQYRPNVVLPGLGGQRDIVRRDLWSSVTCCAPFQEHCATFPTPFI